MVWWILLVGNYENINKNNIYKKMEKWFCLLLLYRAITATEGAIGASASISFGGEERWNYWSFLCLNCPLISAYLLECHSNCFILKIFNAEKCVGKQKGRDDALANYWLIICPGVDLFLYGEPDHHVQFSQINKYELNYKIIILT